MKTYTDNFDAQANLDYINSTINNIVAVEEEFFNGDSMVIDDLDWANDDNSTIKDDVKMFAEMGVKMTYKNNGPTGWPVVRLEASNQEAKTKLIDWLGAHYYSL